MAFNPKRIFISGPLTKGDLLMNVHVAIKAADDLLRAGYMPFLPHLFAYWEVVSPKPYETWMALDAAYLEVCDVVLRLGGESPGSDREVAMAQRLGMPVIFGLDDFWECDRNGWRDFKGFQKKKG